MTFNYLFEREIIEVGYNIFPLKGKEPISIIITRYNHRQ